MGVFQVVSPHARQSMSRPVESAFTILAIKS